MLTTLQLGALGRRPLSLAIIAAVFDPLTLFAAGEQGVWYDPSDFSSLFQDAAGTVAVTAVDQPVGLMLDKRVGAVAAPELILNGTFPTDTANWVSQLGGTLAWQATAVMRVTSSIVDFGAGVQGFATIIGRVYRVRGNLTAVSNAAWLTKSDSATSFGVNRVDILSGVTLAQGANSTFTATAATTYLWLFQGNAVGQWSEWDNISVKGDQNNASQATGAARPILKVDGNGKHYLQFDGVDDAMSTSTINFGTSDKLTLWHGMHKLDETTRMVAELSAGVGTNTGSFYLVSGADGTMWETSISRGGAGAVPAQVAGWTAATAPSTAVFAITHNIAGDLSTLRRNGVAGTSGTGDKGLGNFGSYPLFIGARGGASLFFNGRLYGLIIRGTAATNAQLLDGEKYMAGKTGITLP